MRNIFQELAEWFVQIVKCTSVERDDQNGQDEIFEQQRFLVSVKVLIDFKKIFQVINPILNIVL